MKNQTQNKIPQTQQLSDYDEGPTTNFPAPLQTNGDKHLWIINDYRVWAKTYQDALVHAAMIDKF